MHFSILGAGALGSILAAHLQRAGHDVVLIARGQRAQFLREHGIILRGLTECQVSCAVIEEPQRLTRTDCLIVGTKALKTRESLAALAHVQVDSVLSMQNGILKDVLLQEVFGRYRTLGAMADFSGELLANGEVLFTRNVGFDVGELDGVHSDRVQAIAATIDAAGVRCTAVNDIVTREWSKFVAWCGLVPLAALTRLNTWRYLSDANGATTAVQLVKEAAALAAREGVQLMDLSPLPALTLANSTPDEGTRIVQRIGEKFASDAPGHRMSTLQDIDRGTPLEIDETIGHALALGRNHGLDMPILELSYRFMRVGR